MAATLPRDIRAFLEDYPNNEGDRKSATANLEFYLDKRRCKPDGMLVSEIHEK